MAQSSGDFRYVGRITGWKKFDREGADPAYSIATEPTGPSAGEGKQRTLSVLATDREGRAHEWFPMLREAALEGGTIYFSGWTKPRDKGGNFWNVTKAEAYVPAVHDPKFGAPASTPAQAGPDKAPATPASGLAQDAGVSLSDALRALEIVLPRLPDSITGADSLEWLYNRGLDLVRVALRIQKAANARPEQ